MIVADTNVVAYLYLPGALTSQAQRALAMDPVWAAPLLWRSELRNVLVSYLRRGVVGLEKALQIAAEAELLMSGREYDVPSTRVLAIAAGSRCSAYDCEFVALAQELGVPLVTSDRQVLSEFPVVAVSLEAFVSSA